MHQPQVQQVLQRLRGIEPELQEAKRLALEFANIVVVEQLHGPQHTRKRAMMLAAFDNMHSLALLATMTLADLDDNGKGRGKGKGNDLAKGRGKGQSKGEGCGTRSRCLETGMPDYLLILWCCSLCLFFEFIVNVMLFAVQAGKGARPY